MFETRNSASGEYEYILEVNYASEKASLARHSAKIAEVIDRMTGLPTAVHFAFQWHNGRTLEEAIGRACAEGERAWRPPDRSARLWHKAELRFDSRASSSPVGMREHWHRSRTLVYATDDFVIDLQLQPGGVRGATVIVGQIASNQASDVRVEGSRVLLERGSQTIARGTANRFGEFDLEFDGPSSDLSMTLSLAHARVVITLANLNARAELHL